MTTANLNRAFDWMRAVASELELPGTVEATWLGRPCLRVRGKSFVGSKDGKALVVYCPVDDKEMLLEAAPEIYFQTDHYKGYPAVLIRPECIKRSELKLRIERAWRMCASKPMLADYDARPSMKSNRRTTPSRPRSR